MILRSRARSTLALLALLALLSACSTSPPTRFYALSSLPPAAAPAPADSGATPIRLNPVSLASELNRLQIVRRLGANRIQIMAFDRWAAPLDEMVQRVLTEDLAARLSPGALASPAEPATAEKRRVLFIDIEEFAADAEGTVNLRAAWTLQTPAAPARSGREQVQIPDHSEGAEAIAAAMSRALAALTDQIAQHLAHEP